VPVGRSSAEHLLNAVLLIRQVRVDVALTVNVTVKKDVKSALGFLSISLMQTSIHAVADKEEIVKRGMRMVLLACVLHDYS
jgi:hypothetical protein